MTIIDCAIVGAGPAGLATSRELSARGVKHVVLERGDRVAHTWANLYEGLVLHTGKHLSALPGLPFDRAVPLFPARVDVLDYLHRYAGRFNVPVRTQADVRQVVSCHDGWELRLASGDCLCASSVVLATGIVSNPHVPALPGAERFAGTIVHSAEYRRPDAYAGHRVMVVGAGNSAGEIAAELANAGAVVSVSVRSGRRVVPRAIFGVPSQYFADAIAPLPGAVRERIMATAARASEIVRGRSPLPASNKELCVNVPLIGFHLVDAVRAGAVRLRTTVAELTATAARYADGTSERVDHVILATGFRPALSSLGKAVRVDACGFARRIDRVRSADRSGLYFVGHTYDLRGALRNIGIDARLAAMRIAQEGSR